MNIVHFFPWVNRKRNNKRCLMRFYLQYRLHTFFMPCIKGQPTTFYPKYVSAAFELQIAAKIN